MKKWGLLVALLLSAPSFAGGSTTTKTLVDGCRAYNDIQDGTAEQKYGDDALTFGKKSMGLGYCTGYINGFLSGYSAGSYGSEKKWYCLPRTVTADQISRVLIKRLDDRPEFEDMEPLPFMLAILSSTWPCPATP